MHGSTLARILAVGNHRQTGHKYSMPALLQLTDVTKRYVAADGAG